jgi:hypothetical protein
MHSICCGRAVTTGIRQTNICKGKTHNFSLDNRTRTGVESPLLIKEPNQVTRLHTNYRMKERGIGVVALDSPCRFGFGAAMKT